MPTMSREMVLAILKVFAGELIEAVADENSDSSQIPFDFREFLVLWHLSNLG